VANRVPSLREGASAFRVMGMNIEKEGVQSLKIEHVVDAWRSGGMRVSDEYQRGSEWTSIQQQRLVDSVFRGYPLPLFYFREQSSKDVRGTDVSTFEIVDGQQRIRALSEYVQDKWPTLRAADPKLSLPPAVAKEACPWGGHLFSDLAAELKRQFLSADLPSIVIVGAPNEEEIRDLFIRLQAGTALTRQQVRDAWPGTFGPFIERLAGKKRKRPKFEDLWQSLDRRGSKNADEEVEGEDPYHDYRQTCAQVYLLYSEREKSALNVPSLIARGLDDLYHKNTQFDPTSPEGQRFVELLELCEKVVKHQNAKDKLVLKNDMLSLFMLFQDLTSVTGAHIDSKVMDSVASGFWQDVEPENRWTYGGKTTAPGIIKSHYSWFIETRMKNVVVPWLDHVRLFSDEQKTEIWQKAKSAGGLVYCKLCDEVLLRENAEFDHVIPWIRGGKTETSNGRPVHAGCHVRGIAAAGFKR
jgi:Protein of unknown function DUF262/HNH endonuclease